MPLRIALLMLACLLLPAIGSAQPRGSSDDPFTVMNVHVDATGSNTVQAREAAFERGRTEAFRAMFGRLGSAAAHVDPAAISPEDATRMIEGFRVEQESTSPGRYVADLTYSFRPGEVRAYIGAAAGASPQTVVIGSSPQPSVTTPAPVTASVPAQSVLVLPVYTTGPNSRLWDSPNPWLDAWLDSAGQPGSVDIIVPFGDLEDVVDVSAAQALAGDPTALQRISDRYGADSVVVAIAEVTSTGVTVTLRQQGQGIADLDQTYSQPAEMSGAILPAAVAEARRRLVADEQRMPVAMPGGFGGNRVAVLLPLSSIDDLVRMRERLDRVATLSRYDVLSLTKREAVIRMEFLGDEAQFRSSLEQQGLRMTQGQQALELRHAF